MNENERDETREQEQALISMGIAMEVIDEDGLPALVLTEIGKRAVESGGLAQAGGTLVH
jgi:hypothetical protein